MSGILGKKVGMTRIIKDDGRVIPITVVRCDPNMITQIKTADTDGYPAIVLGFDEYRKPGKCKKFKHTKEFKVKGDAQHKMGDSISVEIFEEGEKVHITGTSKGKGFQGGIKRHNFSRGPETHGSHHHREIGSIGACAAPGRVAKGKKMPGRMGGDKVTLKNINIIHIDAANHLLGLGGAVPGAINSLVIIRKTT